MRISERGIAAVRLQTLCALLAICLAGCGAQPPRGSYRVAGKTYVPLSKADGYVEEGIASWYGADFHGRKTSSGETYDMYGRTSAHKLLPLGTTVRVTNLANGQVVFCRINDRGPFVEGRIIDLSYSLARDLGVAEQGTALVRLEAVEGPGGSRPPGPVLEGPFTWQVGAFTVSANAEALANSLRAEFRGVTIELYDRGDARFQRVRVGTYRTASEAETSHGALLKRGFAPILVRVD